MSKTKVELIAELKVRFNDLDWPGLPPFENDLNEPACNLMEQDRFVAGCLSQIIENNGELDKNFWPILLVDNDLTKQIAA